MANNSNIFEATTLCSYELEVLDENVNKIVGMAQKAVCETLGRDYASCDPETMQMTALMIQTLKTYQVVVRALAAKLSVVIDDVENLKTTKTTKTTTKV